MALLGDRTSAKHVLRSVCGMCFQAIASAARGDRDALRGLGFDDCYRLELRQILEMLDGKPTVADIDAILRELLRLM